MHNDVSSTNGGSSGIRAATLAVLKAFFASWKAAGVYEENNHAYQSRRRELAEALKTAFQDGRDLTIAYQSDYIFVNDERLNYTRDFAFGRQLAERMAELGIGEIVIRVDAAAAQIDRALFTLAHADRRAKEPYEELATAWSALELTDVTIAPASPAPEDGLDAANEQEIDPELRRRRRARSMFDRSEAVVRDFWEHVRDRNSFDAGSVQRVVHQLIDEVAQDEDVLLEIAALKDFDDYTYYHSVDVCIYSIAVGLRLGLDRPSLASLGFAAMLHDIGKVKLPHDLIIKPTEYDDDDWAQVRKHPIHGALTIASLRTIDGQVGVAMATAFEHHMKMDLSGYPEVSRHRDLHLYSRIVTVCDVFDAMTAGRVYQKVAVPPDEALRRIVHRANDWYDRLIVKAFMNTVGVFPVGTLVRLSNGSIALVMRNDPEDIYAPEVLIVRDPDGQAIRCSLSLRADGDLQKEKSLHITDVLEPHKEGIDIYEYIGVIDPPSETAEIDALVNV